MRRAKPRRLQAPDRLSSEASHADGRCRERAASRRLGRSGLRGSACRVRPQLRRARRDRRCRRCVLAWREGGRPVGWPPHAHRRRTVERGHDGRRQFDDQGPGGDDGCRRELARLDRLRRTGRRVLARVRPERQRRDHRAPAPQPRSGVGLDRRAAARRGPARPRPRLSRARAAEAGVGTGNATRLPRDDDRALHAGADSPRRPGAPHARPVLPRGDREPSADRVLHRTPAGDSRRAARAAAALLSRARHPSAALGPQGVRDADPVAVVAAAKVDALRGPRLRTIAAGSRSRSRQATASGRRVRSRGPIRRSRKEEQSSASLRRRSRASRRFTTSSVRGTR